MRILISPAHYLFSDQVGSEPLWAVEIVQTVSKFADRVDVVVGISECHRRFPDNVFLHPLYSHRSQNAFLEFLKKVCFYPYSSLIGLVLLIRHHHSIVHHVLPFSMASFNPLLLFTHYFFPQVKTIIGPAQAPYSHNNIHDVDLVLLGRKTHQLFMFPIEIMVYLLSRLMYWPTLWQVKSVNRFICPSSMAAQFYMQMRKQIVVIPPPLQPIGIRPQKLATSHSPWRLLYVGALVKRKGVSDLLAAMKILAQQHLPFHLTIVGCGEELDSLKTLARKLHLSQAISFVGKVDRSQISSFYHSADIFCLPSYEDSFPTVILEALSANIPIVATNVGSISEMVGKGGKVVPPGSPDALAAAIAKIIQSPNIYAQYKLQAKKHYNSIYSQSSIAAALKKIYS